MLNDSNTLNMPMKQNQQSDVEIMNPLVTYKCVKENSMISQDIEDGNAHVDVIDDEHDDDPGKLLNSWLGDLSSFNMSIPSPNEELPVFPLNIKSSPSANFNVNMNNVRRSVINLEDTHNDELEAILGELNILESQFEAEITGTVNFKDKVLPATDSGHSRSSSGSSSSDDKNLPILVPKLDIIQQKPSNVLQSIQRMHSPDNDSAFCDNSSTCSTSSCSKTIDVTKSSVDPLLCTVPLNSNVASEEQIKAEKIKLALEKMKEAAVTKLFVKVFTSNGSAKSLLIDEKMTVGYVTRILAEKNIVKFDANWALVEFIPELYMERAYEDHENLVDNCLMWKVNSKNTLWFVERTEKCDVFVKPEQYLLGPSSSQRDDNMEDHARQDLLDEYFASTGVSSPEVEGVIWLKAESKKSWKRFYFVLRSSGLYYAPKGRKASRDLVCLSTFNVTQVYYGVGWKKKYKSPTEFCFAIKHPQIQAKTPKYIKYLCVETSSDLNRWVNGIRIAKHGRQLYENYCAIIDELTHADIDIIKSKRFSISSPSNVNLNDAPILTLPLYNSTCQATMETNLTPLSENKSLVLTSLNSFGIASSATVESGVMHKDNTHLNNNNAHVLENQSNTETHNRLCNQKSYSATSVNDETGSFFAPELGFESDCPAGGTIKKRPSANPRIPLTNTTWGIVRDSQFNDDDDSSNTSLDDGSCNIRLGNGGTLLRNAVRQSVIRQKDCQRSSFPLTNTSISMISKSPNLDKDEIVSISTDPLSEAFESSFEAEEEEIDMMLPPPPPPACTTTLTQSDDGFDDLPPPFIQTLSSNESLSPSGSIIDHNDQYGSSHPQLPHNSPSSLINSSTRKNNYNSTGKKISFDDKVYIIEDRSCTSSLNDISPYPTTLLGLSNSAGSPLDIFIGNLQRVLNKKWQIAEKCRYDTKTNPHEVLGFRDTTANYIPNQYSAESNDVGAWVLQTQLYAEANALRSSPPYQFEDNINSSHGCLNDEPPVIIREPSPVSQSSSCHYASTVSEKNFSPQMSNLHSGCSSNHMPSLSMGQKRPNRLPPPPPPPRSQKTQLSFKT